MLAAAVEERAGLLLASVIRAVLTVLLIEDRCRYHHWRTPHVSFVALITEVANIMQKFLLTAAVLIFLSSTALASGVIVYPSKGQSKEQQQKDTGECMSWASDQTGFDPTAPIPAGAAPPSQQPTTSAGRGMLRGALVGTAVGAISGDTGKGARIGAASGLLVGGVRRREQMENAEAQQERYAEQQAAQYAQMQNAFNRAYATCMQGRGYAVN